MNLLLMTDKLTTGGAEIYFCKLENNLPHEKVNVYTAAGSGELYKHIKHKDRFLELSKSNHFMNFWRIRKLICDKKIDIIHANSLRVVLLLLLIRLTILQSFQCIYTKHNVTILEKQAPVLFVLLLNKFVTKVITVSHFERNHLIELGVHRQNITTIYNGVDLKQFQYQDKRPELVFKVGILARISEEKNHALFIEIANRLKHKANIEFYVAGDGPDYRIIKDKIKNANLEQKVKLLGNIEKPENFIREMDVLLLTSKREVFPMVVLEAMAVGTPMISIDKGGIKEAIINNETGILIPEHSVEMFCTKIKELEQNKHLRLNLIRKARQKVMREFSLNSMITKTFEEYGRYHFF
ncbi:glycosyltransferase family 4 protein [Fictibacillus barbaricus]|uniref:Glycosyltransferase family 4 protein n=1 Tax=Fictibacillus barbaricus TaxID=182136 RepID=A0ABS2ZGF3_9BACL|nr:glycosyltransferase family 4 protein [Fictibacillus barbaricus]MBN3546501.1 glycosyltransferase family 4 protein [Fictibacillus barbaricus]GGB41524.1 mannosyltransferase [Fictibacillus barbaricus]